jgi:hypothetical protein
MSVNNIEKFKLIKGNKTYYLGSEGNIKDSYKKYVYKFEKLQLNFSYSISIYKDISEYDNNEWMLEYTIPIVNSGPGKIFKRFLNIKDIIKFRRSSEEYNDLKQYEPYEYEEYNSDNENDDDPYSSENLFLNYISNLN